MRLTSLFSGSKGNCTLISDGKTNILIDCGMSRLRIEKQLNKLNLSFRDINAIFITHEHIDHIAAIKQISNIPIYINTASYGALITRIATSRNIIGFSDSVLIDDLCIDSVALSHDCSYCSGYKVSNGNRSVATITDTGVFTTDMLSFISGADILLLESNHDIDMINSGNYPIQVKRRILSDVGHLSNLQAGQILNQLPNRNVKSVVLGHLSMNNNTTELAFSQAVKTLRNNGIIEGKDIDITVASQYEIKEINCDK